MTPDFMGKRSIGNALHEEKAKTLKNEIETQRREGAKTQRRKQRRFFFASSRLCAIAFELRAEA